MVCVFSILLKAVAKQEYEHFLREAVLEEQADPHHENGERPHSCEVNVDQYACPCSPR